MKHILFSCLACVALAPVGCGGGGGDPDAGGAIDAPVALPDAAPVVEPAAPWFACSDQDEVGATVVVAHDAVGQFWSGWDPGQNARVVNAQAAFPTVGEWQRVFLRVELACPEDGQCDYWDRGASIALIEDDGSVEQPLELARYMTPYRVGMCFVADVTDFAARLTGPKQIRSFIDTWVGPTSGQGHGWRVTTKFLFHAGPRDPAAFAAELIPLWNNQAEDRLLNVGDPMSPLATELPPRTVTIPADAQAVKLRYLVTGHGQGNLSNCAEFCQLTHRTSFGGGAATMSPWRGDCAENPVNTQQGTWQYARAGWCPGAYVAPQLVDITAQATPGSTLTFDHTITDGAGLEFVNTCRPGAGDAQNLCTGCAFDASPGNCDYDNGQHTPPYARFSVQLLVYR